MSLKLNKYIIVIPFSFFGFLLSGQDAKKDIVGIYNDFLSQKNYSVTIKYNLYLNQETSKPYQSREVEMSKNNTKIYLKENSGIESLNTDRYRLLVNHKKKLLSVIKVEQNNSNKEAPDLTKFFDSQIDSVFLKFEKIKIIINTESLIKYECEAKKGFYISKMWIEIDKKTHMYKSIKTLYSAPRKIKEYGDKKYLLTVEVIYEGYKKNINYPETFFDVKKYIIENSKGKIELKQNYKEYELLTSE